VTDYKLACPDCSHDVSAHEARAHFGERGYRGVCHCGCVRTPRDLYAAECVRLAAEKDGANKVAERWFAERDAARAGCADARQAYNAILDTYAGVWDDLSDARAECERLRAAVQAFALHIGYRTLESGQEVRDIWTLNVRMRGDIREHPADVLLSHHGAIIARTALDAKETHNG